MDYFSLDIEGAEYQVLQTIPFEELKIKLFGVEVAHAGKIFDGTANDISNLFLDNGFKYVGKSRLDNFYVDKNAKGIKHVSKIITVS